MTTEAAFLAAIHAEPRDPVHQHVFADWLEDHGDPRAELVRGIVAYQDALGPGRHASGFVPFRLPLPARLTFGVLGNLRAVGMLEVASEGLLRLSVTAAAAGLHDALRPGPGWGWVTHLRLSVTTPEQVRSVLERLPEPLPRVLLLPTLDRAAAQRLAREPLLERVTGLHLAAQSMDDETLAHLLASPHLLNLERLDLGARQVGPRTLDVLANSLPCKGLRELFLGHAPRDRGAFGRMLRAGWVPGLRSLRLLVGPEDAPLLRLLAGSAAVAGLRLLELDSAGLGELDLEMLAAARFWPNLEALGLGVPGLTPATARSLLDMLQGGQLRALRLSRHRIGDDLFRSVAECRYLAGLTHLTFGSEIPPGDPLRLLTRSPHLGHLRALDLRAPQVNDKDLANLRDWPPLERLRHLRFFKNNLSDAGLAALATMPALRNLLSLELAWPTPTRAGVESLAASPHLTGLLNLILPGSRGDEERTALGARFPRVWNVML